MALESAWVGDLGTEGVQTFPSSLVPKAVGQGCPPLGAGATQPQGFFLVGGLGLLPSATAHSEPAGPATTHTNVSTLGL